MTEDCYRLNNEAAFLIQNGEYEKATRRLQDALVLTRSVMTATVNSARNEPSKTNCVKSGKDFCRFLSVGSTSSSRISSMVEDHNDEASLCFLSSSQQSVGTAALHQHPQTMFGSPILFNHSMAHEDDEGSIELFSYVLVYNLALVHHRMALCTPSTTNSSSRGEQLQKALLLYEKSHCLLAKASEKHWDISVLHSLAILCNLGHLHSIMGHYEKSKACYQHLLAAICFVVDARGGGRQGDSSSITTSAKAADDDDALLTTLLDGFFDNVMPILQGNGKVAAAA